MKCSNIFISLIIFPPSFFFHIFPFPLSKKNMKKEVAPKKEIFYIAFKRRKKYYEKWPFAIPVVLLVGY